jgi:hypothetical protein
MSITGYRLEEGLVGNMDRVAAPQDVGHGNTFQNPPYQVCSAADDPQDLRRQIVPLLRLRPSAILCSF